MKLIQQKFKYHKVFFLLICWLISIGAGIFSRNQKTIPEIEPSKNNGPKRLIALSDKENIRESENSDVALQIRKQVDYEIESRNAFLASDYENALKYAQLALNQSLNKNNFNAWGARSRLADVYEAMNKKSEFLKEIDWLIGYCQNEQTKQALISRKQKFLKAHSESN